MPQTKKIKGYLSGEKPNKTITLTEGFKTKVDDEEVKIPKKLGIKHPFDFESTKKVFRKVGFVSASINKYKDSIVGDFQLKVDDENAQAIMDEFLAETDFTTVIREWIGEAFITGNGYLEIDLENNKIRSLNSEHIYVKRDSKGQVTGYSQYMGAKKGKINLDEVMSLDPKTIAHLCINRTSGDAYGHGLIWPNEMLIENLVLHEGDAQKLISRKAGAPYHIKVGVEGEQVNPSVVDEVKEKLTFMNTRTEWVTDANVNITAIDVGPLGEAIHNSIVEKKRSLAAAFQIPEVLYGSGQLNEGIAKVQLEGWQRTIRSYQQEIESVLEEKLFEPLLQANSLDFNVEFMWNLPGESEINARIDKLTSLLGGSVTLSENMKRFIQLELARILDFEGAEDILMQPEKGLDEKEYEEQKDAERKAEEEKIKQPEVPRAKPNANSSLKESTQDMSLQEFVNLKEFQGFTYTDYVIKTMQMVDKDDFAELLARTKQDLRNGLLSPEQVEKLRLILREAFRENLTIAQIQTRLLEDLDLQDRKVNDKVVASPVQRANNIARTETVRLANNALLELYSENNVDKYRFLAALSDRTCPQCEGLNGQVFNIKEAAVGVNRPPLHASCRCSTIAITE